VTVEIECLSGTVNAHGIDGVSAGWMQFSAPSNGKLKCTGTGNYPRAKLKLSFFPFRGPLSRRDAPLGIDIVGQHR